MVRIMIYPGGESPRQNEFRYRRLAEAVSQVRRTRTAVRVGGGEGAGSEAGPSRVAARLVARAVRVLPAADRARYGEELAAELDGLAEAGVSARGQVVFAVRLGARVWALRTESPVPGRSR